MTLEFIDGFDHYVTADLRASYKWNCVGNVSIGEGVGRRGSGCMSISGESGPDYLVKTGTNQATRIIGFAVYFTGYSTGNANMVNVVDVTTLQCYMGVNSTGHIYVGRGPSTILATSVEILPLNTWSYVEFKFTVNNSSGVLEVRVNGASTGWINLTGQDTCANSNQYSNILQVGNVSPEVYSSTLRIDDLYICNGAGTTNNNFLGDCRVDSYLPIEAGGSAQFTPSAGNNWECVDDTAPDEDSTYVQSSTVDHIDTYGFAEMTHTPSSIFGLQINAVAKKDDAGTRSIATVVNSGSSGDVAGTTQVLSTSYIDYTQIVEQDPNTSAAWTKSGINAATFGVKVAA